MVLLSHQLPCILAGLSSAAVVFTAPTGPLPGNANTFGLDMAVFIPRPQTPPPAQPKTNPANMPPPASPATPYTPKPKGDDGSDTDSPDAEPSVPSDSESDSSSTYRVTEKENDPSTKKEETASTKKDNDTSTSDEEDASTSVLARMPATFGATLAVIAWMYV